MEFFHKLIHERECGIKPLRKRIADPVEQSRNLQKAIQECGDRRCDPSQRGLNLAPRDLLQGIFQFFAEHGAQFREIRVFPHLPDLLCKIREFVIDRNFFEQIACPVSSCRLAFIQFRGIVMQDLNIIEPGKRFLQLFRRCCLIAHRVPGIVRIRGERCLRRYGSFVCGLPRQCRDQLPHFGYSCRNRIDQGREVRDRDLYDRSKRRREAVLQCSQCDLEVVDGLVQLCIMLCQCPESLHDPGSELAEKDICGSDTQAVLEQGFEVHPQKPIRLFCMLSQVRDRTSELFDPGRNAVFNQIGKTRGCIFRTGNNGGKCFLHDRGKPSCRFRCTFCACLHPAYCGFSGSVSFLTEGLLYYVMQLQQPCGCSLQACSIFQIFRGLRAFEGCGCAVHHSFIIGGLRFRFFQFFGDLIDLFLSVFDGCGILELLPHLIHLCFSLLYGRFEAALTDSGLRECLCRSRHIAAFHRGIIFFFVHPEDVDLILQIHEIIGSAEIVCHLLQNGFGIFEGLCQFLDLCRSFLVFPGNVCEFRCREISFSESIKL